MPRREPITRESLIDPEGYHCDTMRARLRDRLDLVSHRGTLGLISTKRAPGYAVGVKATSELLDRYDPKPREAQGPAVNITAVVLVLSEPERHAAITEGNGHARAALPAGGLVLHLDGGNGGGA